jgi:hypothetical protein
MRLARWVDEISWRVSAWLPRRLIGHATIRLWAATTSGKWDTTVVPELTVDEALRRWTKG